jgi:flagellar biosynthesis/type III secretory pathway M-ring protein FliF/YscJ
MPSIRSGAGQHNSADRMIDEVKEYASEKPEEIAELIQTWVTENETV